MSDHGYICPPGGGKLVDPMDTRTCHEKHAATDAQRQRDIEQLWCVVTQLQLEVTTMKRLLREWQGD